MTHSTQISRITPNGFFATPRRKLSIRIRFTRSGCDAVQRNPCWNCRDRRCFSNSALLHDVTRFIERFAKSLPRPDLPSSAVAETPLFSLAPPRSNPVLSLAPEALPRLLWSQLVKQPMNSSSVAWAAALLRCFDLCYVPRGDYTALASFFLALGGAHQHWDFVSRVIAWSRPRVSTTGSLFCSL